MIRSLFVCLFVGSFIDWLVGSFVALVVISRKVYKASKTPTPIFTNFGTDVQQLRQMSLHRVSKTVQTYFLSELCQISTDCENFWHTDSKEDKLFCGVGACLLIFHLT